MVLGKVKYEDYILLVKTIERSGNFIIFDREDGISMITMYFENEDASKSAFLTIWNNLVSYGYCDLDKINKKTGMVMR